MCVRMTGRVGECAHSIRMGPQHDTHMLITLGLLLVLAGTAFWMNTLVLGVPRLVPPPPPPPRGNQSVDGGDPTGLGFSTSSGSARSMHAVQVGHLVLWLIRLVSRHEQGGNIY